MMQLQNAIAILPDMRFFLLLLVSCLTLLFPSQAFAQQTQSEQAPQEAYRKADVVKITNEGSREVNNIEYPFQEVQITFLDGDQQGKTVTITHGDTNTLDQEQLVSQGQTVIVRETITPEQTTYQIIDSYRLDKLYGIVAIFIILVLAVSRLKGLGSLIGLGVSIFIIVSFIVPTILNGQDPLITSIVGSILIMITTMYLAHGFSAKTHISLAATCTSLILTGILAYLFVNLTNLTGLGSEDAASLRYGLTQDINFKGLLLGGIIIGTLGVLDDITTSLTASIQELAKANHKLSFRQLFQSGMRIGSEHIASLVNTLALAYVGAGLPLFLFIVLNPADQPLWLLFNSELLVEEIVRTLAGSIGLILAMPLTASFAAFLYQAKQK